MIIKDGFKKAKSYIESHSKLADSFDRHKKSIVGPCITISREVGSGSGIIGEKIVEYLQKFNKDESINWTIFDKNLIEKVVDDHNLPKKLIEYFSEEKLSKTSSMMEELFRIHPPSWTLIQKTSETILHLGQMGYVIIIGRGANIITSKLNNSFSVRLISPFEDRVEHVQDIFKFGKKEAIDYIKKEDQVRITYIKKNFHKDINDPLLYHMILNTHLISYEETAKIIGDAVMCKFPKMFSSSK